MKKQSSLIFLAITFAFVAFLLGFFLGRNMMPDPVTVSVPASMQTAPPETTTPETESTEPAPTITFPINVNTADKEEFMALPGVGEVLAQRILDYRTEQGSFSAVEELLNVKGIGEKRFEEILEFITIGG